MSLDPTPVHRNLHTKVTFLGLEFEDLILVLALAALMNLLAHFVSGNAHVFGIPLNVFMEFVVPALAVPFLILFKYGSSHTAGAFNFRSYSAFVIGMAEASALIFDCRVANPLSRS